MSKGYTWLCHECKELKTLKKKNQNWEEVEEEAEDHPPQKNAECIEIDKYQTEYESYIENIKDEDIESIKEGKWMTDIIITYMLNNLQSWIQKEGKNVICLDPTVVQCIRKGEKTVVEDIIKKRGLIDTEYIFLPVNNNDYLDRDAGSHWSLLVYIKSKDEFNHYDPIRGANKRHALEIVSGMVKASKNFRNKITNIESPQQKNSYDCGTYVIMYAQNIADNIVNNAFLNKIEVITENVSKTRKLIYNYVREKKGLLVGGKEIENNNNGEQAYKTRTMNVCGRHVNHTCWRGRDCTLEHPAMREADVYQLFCRDKLCKLYHPQVCFTNLHHKACKWGVNCKSRHLENDVQGYEHKNNKRRHDNHYSHHDKPLTRSQNHHRHDDGLYDRSYDLSDDRHQNKQEAHDPYRLKNRDMGDKTRTQYK